MLSLPCWQFGMAWLIRSVDVSADSSKPELLREEPDWSFFVLLQVFKDGWKLLVLGSLFCGILALGVAFRIDPIFTARTTFLPPQQGQSSAALALASLGSLASLAGGAAGLRSPGEQYVALMQSVTSFDRIIEQFELMKVYEAEFRVDARKKLGKNVQIALGRRDGLISVEVSDKSPQRAADMANRVVDELRHITANLAVTEAQQRRAFFELQMKQSQERLLAAQQAMQASGFNAGALKAEPRAAAERYGRLRAEVVAAEVRLQTLRGSLTETAPEVRQQLTTVTALREQVARLEQPTDSSSGPDYLGKYRDFKYQEALFEVYARQFELARVDESREGTLIQVVDAALPPERRTSPKRAQIAVATTLITGLAFAAWLLARHALRSRRAVST